MLCCCGVVGEFCCVLLFLFCVSVVFAWFASGCLGRLVFCVFVLGRCVRVVAVFVFVAFVVVWFFLLF